MTNLKISFSFFIILLCVILGALGFLLFLFLAFPVLFWLLYLLKIKQEEFINEYKYFLSQNEGKEFFCYTSRNISQSWVEREVLPLLDKNTEIILLNGKTPKSNFPIKFISHALYQINEIGFPNIMKIVNGEIRDKSLHKELYSAINQKLNADFFLQQLNLKLISLKEL